VIAPSVIGGLTWFYGMFQEEKGAGFQIFVRYSAVWITGISAIIFTNDWLESLFNGLSVILGFVWTGVVARVLWKKHLA
jgi:hypothetical protein